MPVFMRVCANMFAAGRVRFQARLGLRPVGSLHCAARHMHALGCAAQPQRASPDRLAAAPTRLCAAPPPHARPPVPARPCAALQFELALGSLFLEGKNQEDCDLWLAALLAVNAEAAPATAKTTSEVRALVRRSQGSAGIHGELTPAPFPNPNPKPLPNPVAAMSALHRQIGPSVAQLPPARGSRAGSADGVPGRLLCRDRVWRHQGCAHADQVCVQDWPYGTHACMPLPPMRERLCLTLAAFGTPARPLDRPDVERGVLLLGAAGQRRRHQGYADDARQAQAGHRGRHGVDQHRLAQVARGIDRTVRRLAAGNNGLWAREGRVPEQARAGADVCAATLKSTSQADPRASRGRQVQGRHQGPQDQAALHARV